MINKIKEYLNKNVTLIKIEMSNALIITLCLGAIFIFVGCTDAEWDKNIGKLGVSAKVVCYSGGQIIFEDESTGAISHPDGSDGWSYRSKQNGRFREVSADCILTYND